MVKRSPLTVLSYALLGLIRQAPSSGYALMRIFQTTPMGQYSGSPGAIYPALRKLEAAGLIRGHVQRGASLRPRKVYQPTARGGAALRRWLRSEVTPDAVARREPELMLRFALMEGVLEPPEVRRFLTTMVAVTDDYAASLEPLLEADGMTRHARLALQGGIDGLRARAAWARRARQALGRAPRRRRR